MLSNRKTTTRSGAHVGRLVVISLLSGLSFTYINTENLAIICRLFKLLIIRFEMEWMNYGDPMQPESEQIFPNFTLGLLIL